MNDIDKAREAMSRNWYVVDRTGQAVEFRTKSRAEAKARSWDAANFDGKAPHIVCQLAPVGSTSDVIDAANYQAQEDARMVWEAAVAALQGMGCWCPHSEEGYAVIFDNHGAVFALKARWAMNQGRALLAAFKESQA